MSEVRVSYSMNQFPAMDDVIKAAAGRMSDFSGAGAGVRDHGWVCTTEIEEERILRALKKLGLAPELRRSS